jgi:gluconolactonase
VVANNYHSRRLNRPNDVVVKSDGSIYFTDPGLGRIESELDFCGVYRVSPDLGSIHVLVWDFVVPNGLDFSPDERILYVCTGPGGIWIFDPQGTHLGTVATGAQTTNVAWGEADWSTLYFTTWQTLVRIRTKIPGIPVPHGRV